MAQKQKCKLSKQEVLNQAAWFVACLINPEKMGLEAEQVDLDNFIKYFEEFLSQLLDCKNTIYLAIGSHFNTDSSGNYSNDMQFILDNIEKNMDIKFHFYPEAALWVCKDELYSVWSPQ